MFFSGQRQRELIMRVAPIALKFDVAELKIRNEDHLLRKKLLATLGQMHARTNDQASRRNAVVHTAFEWWGGPTQRIVAMSPSKPSKLRDEDAFRYLSELVEDTTLLVLDLADLREEFIIWIDPAQAPPSPWATRIPGYREPKDVRKEERARILQAVALRKPLPPLPSGEE